MENDTSSDVSSSSQNRDPNSTAVTIPPSSVSPNNTPLPNNKNVRSKIKLLLLLITVVIMCGVAAVIYFVLKNSGQAVEATKKDIPSISYGLPDGDLTQIYPAGDTATAFQVNTQLFEGLVRYNKQTRVVPALATSWTNSDTSTWTFNLRHDVKFHSGRQFTAQDVKHSLDYAIAHKDDNSLSNLAYASTIKQVEVISPYQIKITTNGPDPILLNRLTFLFIMDSKAKLGDAEAGTGPYTVKSGTKPTPDTINLVATSNYYGGHIYTRAVKIKVVHNADSLVQGVNNGTFDLAGSFDTNKLTEITRSHQTIERQNLGVSFLGLNTVRTDSPLSTVEGRQAVAYALNISEIIKKRNAHGIQASQIIPPALPGHDPTIKNTPYEPEKAKALLAKTKSASTPLVFGYLSDGTDAEYFGQITKDLQSAGFNIKAEPATDLNDLVNKSFGGQIDIFSLTDDSATLDGLTFFTDLLQGNEIYHNEQVDNLIAQASSALNPSERVAILQKISQIASKELPIIPLYTPTDSFVLTKPYHMQIDIPSAWAGIYFWQVYQS